MLASKVGYEPLMDPEMGDAAESTPAAAELGEVETAVERWEEAGTMAALWLGLSIATMMLSLSTFRLGTIAALLGIVGSAMHCCGRRDIEGSVKSVLALSAGATVLSGLMSGMEAGLGLLLWRGCEDGVSAAEGVCSALAQSCVFYMIWFGLYTTMSALVAHEAVLMHRALNPITNGLVRL